MSKKDSTEPEVTTTGTVMEGTAEGHESITLAHGAFVGEGEDRTYKGPGETITVRADVAQSMRASGYAVTE